MPQDKNGVELKAGDTIRYEGVIDQIALQRVYTEQQDGQRQEVCFVPALVEFVSRPEPTISVELTRSELIHVRRGVASGVVCGGLWDKINDLVNDLDREADDA